MGGAWTAIASWVVARSEGGSAMLRIEDIDGARVVPGSEARIIEDLRWLGLDWDGPIVRQSERLASYAEAIAKLSGLGLVYPCDCSRLEIARAASAPHAGEDSVYPGTCRNREPNRPMKRAPALRVRVPDAIVSYDDGVFGPIAQNLARDVGDFVLRRGDGTNAYQLAVVVDDLAMEMTDVIRGSDLVASTPRQVWLARVLGGRPPRYTHLPLVVTSQGTRIEKRTPRATVSDLRSAGLSAKRIVGRLAQALGLAASPRAAAPIDIARALEGRTWSWRREPWPIPDLW